MMRRLKTTSFPRHSIVVAGLALAGLISFGLVASGGSATASSEPHLKVTQSLVYNPAAEPYSTDDRITITNIGGGTAAPIIATQYLAPGNGLPEIVPGATCAYMPSPVQGSETTTCLAAAALNPGASVTLVIRVLGTIGFPVTSQVFAGSAALDAHDVVNTSTASGWIGDVADLSIASMASPGLDRGTAVVTSEISNNGVARASGLTVLTQMKVVGLNRIAVSAPKNTTCTKVPAATDYSVAISCTRPALAVGASFILRFNVTAKPVTTLVADGQVSASRPADPNAANNTNEATTLVR